MTSKTVAIPTENKPFHELWQLLKTVKPSRSQIIFLMVLTLAATAFEIALPLYARFVVDKISIDIISATTIMTLIGFIVVMAIIQFFTARFGGMMGHQIAKRLRAKLVKHVISAKPQSLDKDHSAELAARINNDSKILKTVLSEDLVSLSGGVVSIIAVITMLFILDWRLSLIIISCIVIGGLVITPITIAMQGVGSSLQASEASLVQNNTEWFKNIKSLKANEAEPHILALEEQLLEDNFKVGMRETTFNAVIGPVANLVLMASLISLLASAGYFISTGTLTLGTLTAFILYLFGLTFPLISLGLFFSNLNKAAGSADRLKTIAALPQELPQEATQNTPTAETSANVTGTSFDAAAIDHLFKIKGLSVNVHNGETDEDTAIIKTLNCDMPKTGLTFLSGPSGAGKSTFQQTLLGFYNISSGDIIFNGQPLDNDNLLTLRRNIAWVEQEPNLIHGSVRDNLLLGNNHKVSENDIKDVLSLVLLEDWYSQINHDLDFKISEQRTGLSGGEKQRFALARAILSNKPVLFLDEPTSALDKVNEAKLMSVIRNIAKSKLVCMITHNPNLVKENDLVINMQ
jgi:ATP-binding cassette, subfamily B, bacterial AbcA/BmrA